MSPEKMVHMANQIAAFFDSQPGDAASHVAAHLSDFWEPRMRVQFLDYVAQGGEGLTPSARKAAQLL